MPGLRTHQAHDVNHYTIVMTDAGLRQVLPLVARAGRVRDRPDEHPDPHPDTCPDPKEIPA
jgi:hypothetical protein